MNKKDHPRLNIFAFAAALLLVFMLMPGAVLALEFPKVCYNGDELAKVREWEKTWAGKKIDSSNVDGVKEFLPESFYGLIKDTDRWGKTSFTILPYETVVPSPGIVSQTRQHYGKTKTGANKELLNYVAGVPFPDTDNALEMAYNFRTRTYGDAYRSEDGGHIVDGKLKYDMSIKLKNNLCFFAGRTDTPPLPEFPENPKNIWRAFTMMQLAPPETRNQRIMEIQYKDFMKPYDMWFWLPAVRRVKRRSTTERQDSASGGDGCGFDNLGWDGPIRINSYKYLAQKEYLLARHNDMDKLEHSPGHCIWNNTQRERVKVHMLEVVNQSPNFLYSKIIWYLCPESWQILYADRYDRRGKMWRIGDQLGNIGKGYNDVDVASFNANQNIDLQRIHGTLGMSDKEYGYEFDKNIFSLYYLQKHGY